jgi:hypothetical protein
MTSDSSLILSLGPEVYVVRNEIHVLYGDTSLLPLVVKHLLFPPQGEGGNQSIWYGACALTGDTLHLEFNGGILGNAIKIECQILDETIHGTFKDEYVELKGVKLTGDSEFGSSITVPITFDSVSVSTLDFVSDTTLFGHIILSVPPYYHDLLEDGINVLQIQREIELFFKVAVN